MNRFKSIAYNKEILYVLGYLATMLILPGMVYAAMAHLLFLVFTEGNEWYLKSILYAILLKFLNPLFGSFDKNVYYLFIVIIFLSVVFKIFRKKSIIIDSFEKKFYLLLLLFYITTFIGSFYIDLSIIKLTVYFMIVFTVFQSVYLAKNFDFILFLINLLYLYVWLSLPMIFLPEGYFVNGLFMGMTQHSQSIGIVLTPIFTLFVVLFLQRQIEQNFFNLSTILLGLLELYLSGSRTASFAILGAFLLYVAVHGIFTSAYVKKYLIALLFLLIGSTVFYIIASDMIDKKISTFVYKSYNLGEVHYANVQEMLGKRGFLIKTSIENFLQHPWTGIGFNVQTAYADPRDAYAERLKYIQGTNIMYDKPLEKGNLYAAVFEEGGVVTGLFFLYILMFLFFTLLKNKIVFGWVTVLSIFISFNGETALFSPGGVGPYQLAILAILFSLTGSNKSAPYLQRRT